MFKNLTNGIFSRYPLTENYVSINKWKTNKKSISYATLISYIVYPQLISTLFYYIDGSSSVAKTIHYSNKITHGCMAFEQGYGWMQKNISTKVLFELFFLVYLGKVVYKMINIECWMSTYKMIQILGTKRHKVVCIAELKKTFLDKRFNIVAFC